MFRIRHNPISSSSRRSRRQEAGRPAAFAEGRPPYVGRYGRVIGVYGTWMLIFLVCLASSATAQTNAPEDFFHRGAQSYIHEKKKQAEQEIITGLQLFPTDPLLNGMAVLLKKQEEQQQKQSQQGQTNQQRQAQSQPEQSDQQKKDEAAASQQGQPQGQEQQEEQPKPGEMTPQEARQLLDAQKEDEKILPVRQDANAAQRNRRLRDW